MVRVIAMNDTELKSKRADRILVSIFAVLLVTLFTLLLILYFRNFHSMNIRCTDDFNLNEYIEEIDKLPYEIKKSFIINQWSLSIEEERFTEHLESTDRSSTGLTGLKSHRIWVRATDALLHEFGHYLQAELNEEYNERIKACYEKEGTQYFDSRSLSNFDCITQLESGEKIRVYMKDDDILGYIMDPVEKSNIETKEERYSNYIDNYYYDYMLDEEEDAYPKLGQYANVDDEEYFAQYFKYWINNRDDTQKMKLLQDKTPDTYELFIELENNGWYMETNVLIGGTKVIFETLLDTIHK